LPQNHREHGQSWCSKLWNLYDRSFLICYALQYFNSGFKVLVSIGGSALFKNSYGLEPATTALLTMVIWMPWDFKIIYGILGDTIPICGSRKRSWLIIMGCT
jgi:hypothetical protein